MSSPWITRRFSQSGQNILTPGLVIYWVLLSFVGFFIIKCRSRCRSRSFSGNGFFLWARLQCTPKTFAQAVDFDSRCGYPFAVLERLGFRFSSSERQCRNCNTSNHGLCTYGDSWYIFYPNDSNDNLYLRTNDSIISQLSFFYPEAASGCQEKHIPHSIWKPHTQLLS